MRTEAKKVNAKLRKRLAAIWAATKGVAYSTEECIEMLRRLRNYYMAVWDDQNAHGEIALTPLCKEMVTDINKIIVAIETERVQADVAIARTIERTPLLLAPQEQIDLAHLLDKDMTEVADA